METGGDNRYKTHSGVRKDLRHGFEQDRSVSAEVVAQARLELDRLHTLKDQDLHATPEDEEDEIEDVSRMLRVY